MQPNATRKQRKAVLVFLFILAAAPGFAFQFAHPSSRLTTLSLSAYKTDESSSVTAAKDEVERILRSDTDILSEDAIIPGLSNVRNLSEKEKPDFEKIRMLGLLWVVALLSSLDRVAMSVAIIPMSAEFGFSDTIKGSISSFFSVGYGLLILPAGFVVASASPRVVMACGLAVWSLATIGTPLSTELYATFVPLLVVRAMVGAAESVVLPTVQRFLSAWTGPQEKSVAIATMQSGFQTGTVLAYLLSPTVMDYTGGWRGLFYTYGSLGLLTIVPWLLFAKDAPEGQEKQLPIQSELFSETFDEAMNTFREAPIREFFQSKGVWAMVLAHSAKNWGLYQTLSWTPTFYSQQYGIGVKDSAFLLILPSAAAIGAGLLAGNVADAVIRKRNASGDELTNIRKIFQSVGLLGPAVALGSLALGLPDDPIVAQASLTASVAMSSFNSAGFEAGNQEKAGERWAGLLYSVTTLPAVMFGTYGVYLTGQILDSTEQDWSIVFGLTSIISALGAAAFVTLYDSKKEFD